MTKANLVWFESELGEGVWVLADASYTMKKYLERKGLEDLDQEIAKYQTPQKYIRQGDRIIVISLSNEIWGGVESFKIDDIIFNKLNDGMIVIRNRKRVTEIVARMDYEDEVEFREAVLNTGYISEDEYSRYFNDRGHPMIQLNNF